MSEMTTTKDHKDARTAFLEKAGWGKAEAAPLAGDASTRSYQRLRMGGENAVLMIAPPGSEAPPCPPDADEAKRRALGYNAMARLAGPNLNAFVALSSALRDAGLSSPAVYAADPQAGLALLEDLGDDLFARIAGKVEEETLYCAGVDALVTLHAGAPFPPTSADYTMLDYDALAMEAEAQLLIDWYWPLKKGAAASDDLLTEYSALWLDALGRISAPHTFVLRDYHAENLLWLPTRRGVERVGVIDFQDALFGHAAYDLVSLLEDARRDVDQALAARMIEYYLSQSKADPGAFLRDYAILAGQRNAKILGIFARLAKRDQKPRYLDLLPRVEAHFRRDLQREDLAALRTFFAKNLPELVS